jgi:hypothetical protein
MSSISLDNRGSSSGSNAPRMGHLLGYARVSTTDQQPHSRSMRWSGPAAIGCSPKRPAAPAPTGLPSSSSWTSSAPVTPWLSGSSTGSAARCGTWSTPSPGWLSATSGSRACRRRTHAGLAAARIRGRHGGRPSVMTAHKLQVAQEMYASGQYSVAAIAMTLGSAGRRSTATWAAPAAKLRPNLCSGRFVDDRPG